VPDIEQRDIGPATGDWYRVGLGDAVSFDIPDDPGPALLRIRAGGVTDTQRVEQTFRGV
jgi:hypothetical protein